jgi:hypothetical protein
MKNYSYPGAPAAGLRLGLFSFMLALSIAYAARPGTANGVDRDIAQFDATSKVDVSSGALADIRLDPSVRHNGSLDEPRATTPVGTTISGNDLVF